MTRLCIQWPRLGPYHLARLNATSAYVQHHGVELVALETAGQDALYAWDKIKTPSSFQREVIFPDSTYEDLDAASIQQAYTKTLDALQPDVIAINSYSTPDARACLLWCKKNRRIAILMSSTKEDDIARVPWREFVKTRLVTLFDAALVSGKLQTAYLIKLGFPADCIFTGYNAIDNAFFKERAALARQHPASSAGLPGLDDETPFFLSSNRFLPRKNIERLLHAYARYRAGVQNPWRLLLLGDGPEREHLASLVKTRNIDGVVFCGFQQIDALPAYYGRARVFVHPALQDQWGLVVNEAMASELPVLVSNKAGCASDLVIEGKNGYSFDPENTAELAQLMIKLSKANLAAMGAASAQIIASNAPERFADALWQAISQAKTRVSGAHPFGRLMLAGIQHLSKDVHSFHSIEEL